MSELRRCLVVGASGDGSNRLTYKANFHRWMDEAYVVEASPLIGGAPAGQIKFTRAIVEDDDGQVHTVPPSSIKFIQEL